MYGSYLCYPDYWENLRVLLAKRFWRPNFFFGEFLLDEFTDNGLV